MTSTPETPATEPTSADAGSDDTVAPATDPVDEPAESTDDSAAGRMEWTVR